MHVFEQPLHLLAGECALCQIMYSLAGLFWRNDLGCASVIPSEQTASSYIILYRIWNHDSSHRNQWLNMQTLLQSNTSDRTPCHHMQHMQVLEFSYFLLKKKTILYTLKKKSSSEQKCRSGRDLLTLPLRVWTTPDKKAQNCRLWDISEECTIKTSKRRSST